MIVTPSGLKIRIDIQKAFTLMARLWEKDAHTDAFRVLKTMEGIQHISSLLGFIGGMGALFYGLVWWQIIAGHCLGRLVGKLVTHYGFFVPGLVRAAMGWERLVGYGLITLLAMTTAWLLKGWGYAAAWLLGLLLGYLIAEWGGEFVRILRYSDHLYSLMGQAEINFYIAYCLHAERLGIRRPFLVAAQEIQTEKWKKCLTDYVEKHPEVFKLFMYSDYL